MEFTHNSGDRYHVTGIDRDGKRFKIETSNPYHALGINLFRGNVWQVKVGQTKRKRIKSVYNF
jgi:hypothetical protein